MVCGTPSHPQETGLVTELFNSVIQTAATMVKSQTVGRTPTPKMPPIVPLTPIQEEDVLDKMDTPVRDWVLSENPTQSEIQTVAEAHTFDSASRPITPDIHSTCSEESWTGTPVHPDVGDTPTQTPVGTPVRTPSSTPSRRRRTPTASPRVMHGLQLDLEGGIPMEASGLIPTYMHGWSPAVLDEPSEQQVPPPVDRPEEEEEIAHQEESSDQETEGNTSAKESTAGSPRVPKTQKRKSISARMTVTSETLDVGEPTPSWEPIFKKRREDIIKGKDIGNRARKEKAAKESSIGAQLGEVFSQPKTYGTSLYKEFRKEQAQLRRDAHNPKFGGKGVGKSGAKRKPKQPTKKVAGPIPLQPLQGWQDPNVVRALAGNPRLGAIRVQPTAAAGAPLRDSNAVVPGTEDSQGSESSTQVVPVAKRNAVMSAKHAAAVVIKLSSKNNRCANIDIGQAPGL